MSLIDEATLHRYGCFIPICLFFFLAKNECAVIRKRKEAADRLAMGKVMKCDQSLITYTARFAELAGFQLESTSFINDTRTTFKPRALFESVSRVNRYVRDAFLRTIMAGIVRPREVPWYNVEQTQPPPSSIQSDGTAWDSRGNTLTFHTFRPDGAPANGRVVSPRLPARSPAIGNPHSPGYEPNAYRPSVGYPYTSKQTHYHPTADYATNGYHHDVEARRVYTYVEEDVVVRLEEGEMRVGFAMSGGADELQTSLINNILPGSPADRAGLTIGDEIIEVNGVPVERSNHGEIVQLIHKVSD
uniref:PDZ domain-containing protein n=1 Tax=Plectus sambesii TaxID=2011161 RepID=A0A914VQ41_9BILA